MFWLGFLFGALAISAFLCICVAMSSKSPLSYYDSDFLIRTYERNRNYFNNPVVEHMKRTDRDR